MALRSGLLRVDHGTIIDDPELKTRLDSERIPAERGKSRVGVVPLELRHGSLRDPKALSDILLREAVCAAQGNELIHQGFFSRGQRSGALKDSLLVLSHKF